MDTKITKKKIMNLFAELRALRALRGEISSFSKFAVAAQIRRYEEKRRK